MKKIINTTKSPKAIGPYSQGILETNSKNIMFISGQLPIDINTGKMLSDIESQMKQSLKNLKNIIEEANLNLNNVIKTTIFLKNMSDFPVINKIYADFFGDHCPSRSTVEVAKLPLDALVEIEAIATE